MNDNKLKLDMLHTIQSILQTADADLSWDTLPNRWRIQQALKYTNTLIAIEPKLVKKSKID
jgi:hypothetical protein